MYFVTFHHSFSGTGWMYVKNWVAKTKMFSKSFHWIFDLICNVDHFFFNQKVPDLKPHFASFSWNYTFPTQSSSMAVCVQTTQISFMKFKGYVEIILKYFSK